MVRTGEVPSSGPFGATFPLRGGRRAAQVCRPYGKNELPLYRTVPLIRHALRDTCPYPLWPLAIIPTPFGLRPFPPDRGNRPLDKGSRPPLQASRKASEFG